MFCTVFQLLQSAVSAAAHASLSSTTHLSATSSVHAGNHVNHGQSHAAAAILQQTLNSVAATTAHSITSQQNARPPTLTSPQVATTTNGFPPSVSQLLPSKFFHVSHTGQLLREVFSRIIHTVFNCMGLRKIIEVKKGKFVYNCYYLLLYIKVHVKPGSLSLIPVPVTEL